MTDKAILDRYDALLLELHADGLTLETWLSLVERVDVLIDETGVREMISSFLREGDKHGWEHPRYRWDDEEPDDEAAPLPPLPSSKDQ